MDIGKRRITEEGEVYVNPSIKLVGSVGLVKGSNWLSRMIRKFMRLYRNSGKFDKNKVTGNYNHAFILINIWGELYCAEALAKGITLRPFEIAYPKNRYADLKMFQLPILFDEYQLNELSKLAANYSFNPTRYEYTSFFIQILYIVSTWLHKYVKFIKPVYVEIGKKNKRFYCSEYVALVLQQFLDRFYPNYGVLFDNPRRVNPLDIEASNMESFYIE